MRQWLTRRNSASGRLGRSGAASGGGGELVTDAITGELRALAGPGLYRRNAFRISGLPATADRRTTRQTLQRLRAALQVGADVDFGPTASRDPHEIQAACDLILGDPRRRLVHELFALWGDDVSACRCPLRVHQVHDAAVTHHAKAIQAELDTTDARAAALTERDHDWSKARKHWTRLQATDAFWAHLEHRIQELDDRQLDQTALDGIEAELPRTLLKPLTDLAGTTTEEPGRLVEHVLDWPVPDQVETELLQLAADPWYEDLDERRAGLSRRIEVDSPDAIVAELEHDLLPDLGRLDALAPPERNHRTAALHDQLAILLNNCAVQLLDRGEVTDGRAEQWLDLAADLAIDARDQELVEDNRRAVRSSIATLMEFEHDVYRVLISRGEWATETMLRQVRRDNPDSPAIQAVVDRMLREISDGTFTRRHLARSSRHAPAPIRPPSYSSGRGYPVSRSARRPRRWRRGRRVLFLLLVVAALGFTSYRWGPLDLGSANVYAAKIADNAKPGTCLADQSDDWRNDATSLRERHCGKAHWGEVLGYVPVGPAPGPYPGRDQSIALATFGCGELLAQQELSPAEYKAEVLVAPQEHWNTGTDKGNQYENYASCILRRTDNTDIEGGRKIRAGVPATPKPVEMDVYGASVAGNAPIGSCLQRKGSIGTGRNAKVPVVRCSEWHWAEVFGYPVVFKAGSAWPGDQAVFAAAKKACSKVVPSLPGFTTTVGWPDFSWWNNPKQSIYTYCLVHRVDGKQFKGRLR